MPARILMDARYMNNVEPLPVESDAFKDAKVVVFTPMTATESRRMYGIEAQSLEGVPLVVDTDGMGMKYVNFEQLIPLLVNEVKHLSARLAVLESSANPSVEAPVEEATAEAPKQKKAKKVEKAE